MQQTRCNPGGNNPQCFLPGFLENKRLSSEQRQTMHTQKKNKISPMLKQRLKADVTEQEIPCGLSKGQGYLWKPEKMVTSLGNFKWNVQFHLLEGLGFVWVFWFFPPATRTSRVFQDQGGVVGICCNVPWEGMGWRSLGLELPTFLG